MLQHVNIVFRCVDDSGAYSGFQFHLFCERGFGHIVSYTLGKSNNITSASNLEFTFLSIFSNAFSRPLTTPRAADKSNCPAKSSISTLRSTLTNGVLACAVRNITSRQYESQIKIACRIDSLSLASLSA